MTNKISTQVQSEAQRIANGTTRKGQSKEQTKLIAQGIEKGISEYKKQQKVKARERDKQRKKDLKVTATSANQEQLPIIAPAGGSKTSTFMRAAEILLPWLLLSVSWGYFFFYIRY